MGINFLMAKQWGKSRALKILMPIILMPINPNHAHYRNPTMWLMGGGTGPVMGRK